MQEGWETIKEIDKVLGHLEGRLDKVTAAIRQVAVQGKALELNVSGEDEIGTSSGESLEELEAPALKSSLEEHRIVDVQKPVPGPPKPGESQEEPRTPPSGVEKDDRREDGEPWQKNKRVQARTQFGKRLLLLPYVEASEVIPAEEEDDDEYVEKGVSKEPTASAEVLEEEENRDAQCI